MTRLEFQPYESDNDDDNHDDNHDDNDKSWPRSSIMLSPFGRETPLQKKQDPAQLMRKTVHDSTQKIISH